MITVTTAPPANSNRRQHQHMILGDTDTGVLTRTSTSCSWQPTATVWQRMIMHRLKFSVKIQQKNPNPVHNADGDPAMQPQEPRGPRTTTTPPLGRSATERPSPQARPRRAKNQREEIYCSSYLKNNIAVTAAILIYII